MNVSEKLIQLRKSKGLSQEKLAEKLGVSRQAISRWENGTALPDANNILSISKLYNVTTDYLLNDDYESDDDLPKVKENKKILHTNLTLVAIIAQGAFLNAFAQPWVGRGVDRGLVFVFKIMPLLLASIWMANNQKYEKNIIQRAKNTKIELVYCLCQAAIAIIGYLNKWGLLTASLLIIVMFVYIFIVNPKYMNRKLVQMKKKYST